MLTAIEQECADRRAAIIAQAKLLCTQGGHYLWGAQGQKPAPSGPVILANPILDSANLANTQFCAATLNGNVCAGRFRAHDVWLQLPVQKIWNTLTDDVSKFVKANAANPGAQVGWTGGLTPRCILGYTNNDAQGSPTDYEGGGPLLNKVVWGEGCDDTQHFDCNGFVQYVVQMVCGVSVRGFESITDQRPVMNKFGQPLGTVVKTGEEFLPADVLCFKGHVAFVLDGGAAYAVGAPYTVVHAESAVYGLNFGKSKGGHYKCIRLSPSTILNRLV
jgi:hypothetical protein